VFLSVWWVWREPRRCPWRWARNQAPTARATAPRIKVSLPTMGEVAGLISGGEGAAAFEWPGAEATAKGYGEYGCEGDRGETGEFLVGGSHIVSSPYMGGQMVTVGGQMVTVREKKVRR